MTFRPLTIILALLASFAISPCSGNASSEEIIEAAKKEGELVFYSGIPIQDMKVLTSAFEKKYPFIKTKFYRSGSVRLISRIQTEHRAGRHEWDVYNASGFESYTLVEEGMFAKYESPEREHYPTGYKDDEGFWATMYTSPIVGNYNTVKIQTSDLPKTYSDLLQPKWKGKIALDSREVEWYGNLKNIWGAEKAQQFIKGLVSQDLALREGRTLLTQLLAAGEFSVLPANYLSNIIELKEKGAPIEWLPLDPIVVRIGPIAIYRHAPHPNAAKLFVDFSLSEEGQNLLVKLGRTSARQGIKGNPLEEIKGAKSYVADFGLGKHYNTLREEFQNLLGISGR